MVLFNKSVCVDQDLMRINVFQYVFRYLSDVRRTMRRLPLAAITGGAPAHTQRASDTASSR
jgi:hypothetical protein